LLATPRRDEVTFVPRSLQPLHPASPSRTLIDMSASEASPPSHTLSIRVRYPEVDAMGYLHHSRYLQYFEMGRVELLRSLGHSYADLERDGVFFVVVKVECRYKSPARYDEELTLMTKVVKQTHVRIDHAYELLRGETLLAEAQTTIACVGRDGQLREIPENLRGS
jgi:acyl-CoA thioester hydrolase